MRLRKIQNTATAILILVAALAPAGSLPALATSGTSFTAPAPITALFNTATSITGLQITASGNPTLPVKLKVSHGSLAMTTTTGLTFDDATSGPLIGFSGTVSNLNAALATLTYTRTEDVGADTLEVSMVHADMSYDADNNHVYQYLTSYGSTNWDEAVTAVVPDFQGSAGHLATISSADENNFIAPMLTNLGWIAASDNIEGNWQWLAGPEFTQQFWNGDSSGSAVSGRYNNWDTGQPNNSSGNEDCAQMNGNTGTWSAVDCTDTLAGFIMEYGDDGHTLDVPTRSVAITTAGDTHNIATCAQLNALGADTTTRFDTINLTANIDCTGIDFAPMYSDDGFGGVLDGQNHQITNLVINRPSDGDVGLLSYARDATIKRLILASGHITGDYLVGAIAGETAGTTITGVVSHLDVDAVDYYVGGLVGTLEAYTDGHPASLTNSSSTGDITTAIGSAGGLIGYT